MVVPRCIPHFHSIPSSSPAIQYIQAQKSFLIHFAIYKRRRLDDTHSRTSRCPTRSEFTLRPLFLDLERRHRPPLLLGWRLRVLSCLVPLPLPRPFSPFGADHASHYTTHFYAPGTTTSKERAIKAISSPPSPTPRARTSPALVLAVVVRLWCAVISSAVFDVTAHHHQSTHD